jgi:hypothetical protein
MAGDHHHRCAAGLEIALAEKAVAGGAVPPGFLFHPDLLF